jgi:MYXO-CTERM domain-containing protein
MFIALDSNSVGDAAQKTFLTGRLAAARADDTIRHVFVWFHHSAYSVGDHGDSSSVKQAWVPLFDDPANKVTAVFSGHDHIYNRLTDGSKVVYVVSGGAGANLYGTSGSSAAQSIVARSTYNFVALHIAGDLVTATAFDDAGNSFDTWMVNQGGPPPPDAGSVTPPPDAGAAAAPDLAMATPDDNGQSPHGGCSVAAGQPAAPPALAFALAVLALLARRRRS